MPTPTRLTIAAATIALSGMATVLAAPAHAEENRVMFKTPSGNISCAMDKDRETPYVACQLENIDYVVPPGVAHDSDGDPCPSNTGSGNDVMLEQGKPGYVRCSFASIGTGVFDWITLAYGDSVSFGALTCASAPNALTCTDTTTGHFLRVSRKAYEVG